MSRVIAIDGPAASGKSSTAAEVARRLGFLHVDSGALYRAMTLVALDLAEDAPADAIIRAAERRDLRLRPETHKVWVLLDSADAEPRIRSREVNARVSAVSAMPPVREWVNRRLRELADDDRPLVLDGRDIGTAVFPNALVKVYLEATPHIRAGRRLQQMGAARDADAVASEAERIAARDHADSNRELAPLRAAPDAVRLDTSTLDFEEQVARIVALVHASPLSPKGSSR
jgi:cytidylate kinase